MSPANIKVVFFGAICFVLWGGYNVAKSSYIEITWTKVEGTVVDFERNTWSCGKHISTCYELIVGYQAGKKTYTVNSKKKFNHDKPTHLLNEKVVVYYSPANNTEAILGGSYGPSRYGMILFLAGCVVLIIFWVMRKKAK
jgi:hypothetical protein